MQSGFWINSPMGLGLTRGGDHTGGGHIGGGDHIGGGPIDGGHTKLVII